MKNLVTLILITALSATTSFAGQGNIVFFTENGEKFTVFLNSIQQNATPEANVKITDLTNEFYKARIVFEDKDIIELNKNIRVSFGNEVTYVVKRVKSGNMGLRFMGESPLTTAPATPADQTEVAYTNTPRVDTDIEVNNDVVEETVTTTTTTTTTTSGSSNGDGENVSIKMDVGGIGVDVDVDIDDEFGNVDISETHTSTTTTTTTTTVKSSGGLEADMDYEDEVVEAPSYSDSDCYGSTMTATEFADAKKSISSKTFSDTKMSIAKQIVKKKCITAEQARDIARLFTMEDDKLDFAKYAYDYTIDQDNYYKVNDAFEMELTMDELNEFLESK